MKYGFYANLAQMYFINNALENTFYKEKKIKINSDDLLYLDFIRELFPKQKMEKLVIQESEHEELIGMSFVWINYRNMFEQLPYANLGTEDTYRSSISRKIKKLVDLGLVYSITVADDKYGKKTYLAPTELSEYLYEKVNDNDENIELAINKTVNTLLTKMLSGVLTNLLTQYILLKKKINIKEDNKRIPPNPQGKENKVSSKVESNQQDQTQYDSIGTKEKQNTVQKQKQTKKQKEVSSLIAYVAPKAREIYPNIDEVALNDFLSTKKGALTEAAGNIILKAIKTCIERNGDVNEMVEQAYISKWATLFPPKFTLTPNSNQNHTSSTNNAQNRQETPYDKTMRLRREQKQADQSIDVEPIQAIGGGV